MITVIAILGPTASGKSQLAMSLALQAGGEILSVDSRQAYRHLEVGTSKPSPENRRAVVHHLIDILELHEKNNAQQFARMAHDAARAVASRGKLPIFAGGSGLYYRAITHGFFNVKLDSAERAVFSESLRGLPDSVLFHRLQAADPESARRIHRNDRYRIVRALEVSALTGMPLSAHLRDQQPDPLSKEIRFVKIGIDIPRADLHRRIEERALMMLRHGWVEETEQLLAAGADADWPGMKTLGYPQVVAFLQGRSTYDDTLARIVELTRQYAKRQVTWFKREAAVTWLRGGAREMLDAARALVPEHRGEGG
jgi:tRNA dimethylallyltransferase